MEWGKFKSANSAGNILGDIQMKQTKLTLLISLAKRGALQNHVFLKTQDIASELRISQQSASRWLQELQTDGLIMRHGKNIAFSAQAVQFITQLKEDLGEIFSKSNSQLRIIGKLMAGMHEGRYYLSIPEYKRQLKTALGYEVYPGTLNLKLTNEKSLEAKRRLSTAPGIEIAGFSKNGRTLGGAKLFKAKIIRKNQSVDGAIIIPYKTHYGIEIVELVSDEYLRKKMNLKNNDEIEVIIDL